MRSEKAVVAFHGPYSLRRPSTQRHHLLQRCPSLRRDRCARKPAENVGRRHPEGFAMQSGEMRGVAETRADRGIGQIGFPERHAACGPRAGSISGSGGRERQSHRTRHEFHPGDALVIPKGWVGTWDMKTRFKKIIVNF
jgi:hypothetical protein